jgi:hypothetical protein
MKTWILFLGMLCMTSFQINLRAQEARFYVKLKSAAMDYAPDLIEERIAVLQENSCRTEKFILYRKRAEVLDSSVWKICTTAGDVEIFKNDAPYHQFKLEDGEQEGRIGQVKGKLVVKAIRDSGSGKILVWEVNDKFDKRYRIIYNPEAKRVESQFEPFAQRHVLQNFVFRDLPSDFIPLSNPAATMRELKPGDALQIVYYEKTDTGSFPRQINDYIVLERDVKPEFPLTRIAFTSTDLYSGVTMNNDTVEIQEFSDGLFIGNNLAIPYAAYKSGFSRIDPKDGDWRCYVLPREDFVNPLLELVYQETMQLDSSENEILRYWNSELPYRISWIRNFPLPFQEYEKLIPKIEYIKRDGMERGKKLLHNASLKTGIRFFDETPDGMKLTLFIASKGSYSIELVDGENQIITMSPSPLKLKAGMQKLELKCPGKLPDRYYKAILKQVDPTKQESVQEYIFLSRYF